MPLAREVDFVPPGDYAFVAVRPLARQRCELWLFSWGQVENGIDDGRTHPPRSVATMANREMIQLAKHLLFLAGHPAIDQIVVPAQEWDKHLTQNGDDNDQKSIEENSTQAI